MMSLPVSSSEESILNPTKTTRSTHQCSTDESNRPGFSAGVNPKTSLDWGIHREEAFTWTEHSFGSLQANQLRRWGWEMRILIRRLLSSTTAHTFSRGSQGIPAFRFRNSVKKKRKDIRSVWRTEKLPCCKFPAMTWSECAGSSRILDPPERRNVFKVAGVWKRKVSFR